MDKREQIKEIMRIKNISSVRQLARIINMTEGTLNNQMAGNRAISLETIEAILNTFEDISADWLLRGKGDMMEQSAQKYNFVDLFLNNMTHSDPDELDKYQAVLTSVRELKSKSEFQ